MTRLTLKIMLCLMTWNGLPRTAMDTPTASYYVKTMITIIKTHQEAIATYLIVDNLISTHSITS
jgi:hypothetical protein